ncbi:hypothetical protein PR048_031888 [Dryococelus australis]|uniref:Uncharacterized protein n=1 Tax=Dryococelus australis TaxID=614101 RepID=A0ABQ9GAJ8_9NEOP|nr:hypothetical protein PR048_031888 [Dryococelus australis]
MTSAQAQPEFHLRRYYLHVADIARDWSVFCRWPLLHSAATTRTFSRLSFDLKLFPQALVRMDRHIPYKQRMARVEQVISERAVVFHVLLSTLLCMFADSWFRLTTTLPNSCVKYLACDIREQLGIFSDLLPDLCVCLHNSALSRQT